MTNYDYLIKARRNKQVFDNMLILGIMLNILMLGFIITLIGGLI